MITELVRAAAHQRRPTTAGPGGQGVPAKALNPGGPTGKAPPKGEAAQRAVKRRLRRPSIGRNGRVPTRGVERTLFVGHFDVHW